MKNKDKIEEHQGWENEKATGMVWYLSLIHI